MLATLRRLSVLLVPTLVGCIGSTGGGSHSMARYPDDTRFPSASDVNKLGDAPPPSRITSAEQKAVDAWDLKDAPDPAGAAPRAATPWEQLLIDASAKRQGLLLVSEPMHCLARQVGAFLLANGALPSDDLNRFMAARCGVIEPTISFAHVTGTTQGAVSDDQFFTSGRASAQGLIDKYLLNGNQVAGIWAGRSKDKVAIVVPLAVRRAKLDRVPVTPDASGHVVIQGEVLVAADRIDAIANYGRFGFRRCAVDARVRLPRFAVDCETKPDDPSTMIEIGAFAPGRIVGPFVADVTVWSGGRVSNQYARPSYGALPVARTGEGFPANLAAVLNSIRKQAGLSPVVFNVDESSTAARVAPHYFGAIAGTEDETIADRVVLGLRAGWQIPGLIGHGHFASAMSRDPSDATALLLAALDRPSGREALLDPESKFVAIGPFVSKSEGILAGVFTSYSLFEPASKDEAPRALEMLNARRRERRLVDAKLLTDLQGAATSAARLVELGTKAPEQAMDELLETASRSLGSSVQGWFAMADTLEKLPFPDKLLESGAPRVAIGVAHFKPRGSPWGAYGVFLLMPSNGSVFAEARPLRSPHAHRAQVVALAEGHAAMP